MMRKTMAVAGLLGLSIGCGSTEEREWPARAKVQSCASGWQPTGAVQTDPPLPPRVMAWADGMLYLSAHGSATDSFNGAGLVAVPAAGGAATRVAVDWAISIFVDGENLLYSHDTRLMRVPRAGGTPEVVLEDPAAPQRTVQAHLVDDTHFVWATLDSNTTLWRMPRAGGVAQELGPLGISVDSYFAFVPDGVIATGPVGSSDTGRTWDAVVMPFEGGTPRRLGDVSWPFLADRTGVLWSALLYTDGKVRQAFELRRTPADGGEAVPLSTELPVEMKADWAVPDGQGGYLLSGVEYFDDMVSHRSVFAVAADGHATRIACDPSTDAPIVASAAVAPDALYVSARYLSPDGWTIVRVPR